MVTVATDATLLKDAATRESAELIPRELNRSRSACGCPLIVLSWEGVRIERWGALYGLLVVAQFHHAGGFGIYVFEGDQVVLPAEAQEARRDYVQVAQFSLVSVDVEAGYVTELPIPGVQYPMPTELMLRWSGVLVPARGGGPETSLVQFPVCALTSSIPVLCDSIASHDVTHVSMPIRCYL